MYNCWSDHGRESGIYIELESQISVLIYLSRHTADTSLLLEVACPRAK